MKQTPKVVPHLLVVDDDPIVTMLHKRISMKAGLNSSPQVFMDGQQALDFIAEHDDEEHHHLVLLDINMPVMDGWEMLEEVNKKNLSCNIKVVMATSSLDAADEKRAGQYPCVIGYLTKPIRIESLEALKDHPELEDYMKTLSED